LTELKRPKSFGSTYLEVGGSHPFNNEDLKSTDQAVRHLLVFLFDVAESKTCHQIVLETNWRDQLGLLYEKVFPTYGVGFAQVFYRFYNLNNSLRLVAETHLSQEQLLEIRSKAGGKAFYYDPVVPIQAVRFEQLQARGEAVPMPTTDLSKKTFASRKKNNLMLSQFMVQKRVDQARSRGGNRKIIDAKATLEKVQLAQKIRDE